MLAERKEKFKKLENLVGRIFSKLGPSPNQYTLNSIFFGFFAFLFLVYHEFLFALLFFLVAGFLDFVDGAVARYSNRVTKRGAYLDTMADRLVEGFVFLGLLFVPLRDLFLPYPVWLFLAFFGSLMTTYAKAAGKEKEILTEELKSGLLGRAERILMIVLVLVLLVINKDLALYPLILLAIFSNFTALQRMILVVKKS